MEERSRKLTREQLYELVWSKPASKLAEEIGISDVAIAKHCKKLNVPKPYLGYWQQINAGQRVRPPKLPAKKPDQNESITIYPFAAKPPSLSSNPELSSFVETERQPSSLIEVSDTLYHPHSLVAQAKKLLEKASPDEYGRLHPPWNQPCLDIHVSKDSLSRALRIMDALVKALEARGHSVIISNEHGFPTKVVIANEQIKIQLTEKADRQERSLSNSQKQKSSIIALERWVYSPSGKLTFLIDEYWSEKDRKRWSDHSRKSIEELLNEIVLGLVVAAHRTKARRIELEEQHKKWQEAEKRHQQEEQRRKTLEIQTEMWSKSQKIRSYIQACEASCCQRMGALSPESAEAKWLQWALDYAARIDPLLNGAFDNMFKLNSGLSACNFYDLESRQNPCL